MKGLYVLRNVLKELSLMKNMSLDLQLHQVIFKKDLELSKNV
jgi:hypothetical protein